MQWFKLSTEVFEIYIKRFGLFCSSAIHVFSIPIMITTIKNALFVSIIYLTFLYYIRYGQLIYVIITGKKTCSSSTHMN